MLLSWTRRAGRDNHRMTPVTLAMEITRCIISISMTDLSSQDMLRCFIPELQRSSAVQPLASTIDLGF